jgi:hypothetical protein
VIHIHKHAVLVDKVEQIQDRPVVMRQNAKVILYLKKNSIRLTNSFLVPEIHLQPPVARRQRRSSPNNPDLPPMSNATTTVTIENETKPKRKKKTFKTREGEEIEMTVRKGSSTRRRRPRTTSKERHSESESTIDPGRDKILGIVVHRTDRLRTDLRLRHPLVRVHIIDLNTRSYVRKTDPYVFSLQLRKKILTFHQKKMTIFSRNSTNYA